MARYLLKRSSVIIARDLKSQKVAQDLVGSRRKVSLSPDVAFSLESIPTDSIELAPPLKGQVPDGIIGLNVNGLMYNGGYSKDNMFGLKLNYPHFLEELMISLLQQFAGEVWLVPHTFAPEGNVESDPEASLRLRDALPPELRNRVRIVSREYDQYEIKGVIGHCDFFIGSRMHACIAALSQGVPCAGVAYSMKFRGVFESVGMEEWVVDGRKVANREAVARIIHLYQERDSVRLSLAERSDDARQRLMEVFHELVTTDSSLKFSPSEPIQ